MRMGGPAELRGRGPEFEGETRLGDEVGDLRPDQVHAEDRAALGVAEDLAESLRLPSDVRLGDREERHLPDDERDAVALQLLGRGTDRCDLRSAVRRARLQRCRRHTWCRPFGIGFVNPTQG